MLLLLLLQHSRGVIEGVSDHYRHFPTVVNQLGPDHTPYAIISTPRSWFVWPPITMHVPAVCNASALIAVTNLESLSLKFTDTVCCGPVQSHVSGRPVSLIRWSISNSVSMRVQACYTPAQPRCNHGYRSLQAPPTAFFISYRDYMPSLSVVFLLLNITVA